MGRTAKTGAGRQMGGSWERVGWDKNNLGRKLMLYDGRTEDGRWYRVHLPINIEKFWDKPSGVNVKTHTNAT